MGAEPALVVPGVGGGDGTRTGAGGGGLQAAQRVVGIGHRGRDAVVYRGALGEQAPAGVVGEGPLDDGSGKGHRTTILK